MNHRRIAAALVCAIALAGCGNLTKSPADGLTFKAPDGFDSKLSAMGVMQVWVKGDQPEAQVMMLLRSPIAGKSWSVDDAMKNAHVGNGDVVTQQKITICGNEPALYVHAHGTVSSVSTTSTTTVSKKENVEMVLTQSTQPILALYTYPIDATPDTAAESALRDLCSAPGTAAS